VVGVAIVLVRLESPGHPIYRQRRVGRDGEPFELYKLRTMVSGAEQLGLGMAVDEGDDRITRVGAWLRRMSIDELPNLLNIWRGEMSLVGPRPLVVDEDAQVLGLDRQRLHLTPGMTGPWQVLDMRVPMGEMVGLDYLYVANWSLWLDFKLLVRTGRHVVRGGNI
jgi:lipopolysaccharide/colanic/teichoic acid biosynthesis glycosyltransferase